MSPLLARLKIGAERYPALTGVRTVGASIVFFDHFPWSVESHLIVNVMAFFFALSGFLIVRIYYEQVELSGRWLSKYFVNRFARIYPVYFLLLSVVVVIQHELRPWDLLRNFTLTHALFHGADVMIQPSWSLTTEECFYFLAPLFMLLARRWTVLAPLAAGSLLLAAALAIAKLPGGWLHTSGFLQTTGFVLTTTFFGHFLEFFAGGYLALATMRLEKRGPIGLPGSRYTLTGLAAVSLLAFAMIMVYERVLLNASAIIVINNFLIPVPIALLYWGLLRESTVLSRLLASRLFGLLGRASYSFYLLHTLIIDYISTPLLLHSNASRPLCVMLTFLLTWLLAITLFLFYEEPVNLWLRGKFHSRQPWVGMQATLFR
jgi:peptidoglycan/LPS O-acetylase OafA/YrhL